MSGLFKIVMVRWLLLKSDHCLLQKAILGGKGKVIMSTFVTDHPVGCCPVGKHTFLNTVKGNIVHKIIVAKIDRVIEIPGANTIQEAVVLGEHIVVSKDISVGDVGLFCPVDLQLSEQFCYENNLFRDKEKNKDTSKAGFFENTRRVRAQPFLKVKSCGLFMPLSS